MNLVFTNGVLGGIFKYRNNQLIYMPNPAYYSRVERRKNFSLREYVEAFKSKPINRRTPAWHTPALHQTFSHAIGLPRKLTPEALRKHHPGYAYIGNTVTGATFKYWYAIPKARIEEL